MRGNKQAPKRKLEPDVKFNRTDLAKFINYIMGRGKKNTARSVVYNALELVKEQTKEDPLKIFDEAIQNIAPQMEVRSRRVGGSNYQIPFPVTGTRQQALTFRWLIGAARSRKGKPMHEKLAEELIQASKGEGSAIKKKEDVHRMAEANRAFAHFR